MKQGMRYGFVILMLAIGALTAAATVQKADKGKEATLTEEQQLAMGKQLYDAACKSCHRSDGKGTLEEMDLTDSAWRHGSTPEEVEKVIREGVKGTGMRAIMGEHPDQEIKALVRYVLKFSANAPPAQPAEPPKPPEPPAPPRPPAHLMSGSHRAVESHRRPRNAG